MNQINNKLTQLGIKLPDPPAPVAAYVPYIQVGNYVYTSGQLPFIAGKEKITGIVGYSANSISTDAAKELAKNCILNTLAVLQTALGSLDSVEQIIKLSGFVASKPDFLDQPKVINGASELLNDIFGQAGKHARSAIGVASLPLGAPVEIELIAKVKS